MKKTSLIKMLLVTLLLGVTALSSKAQLNPFQSMYFQNKYIYNPAMAGIENGFNINTGYRQQWSSFKGTPQTGLITAEYQPTDKVGLGININDDQAGLIRQTRIMGTYAYHLPLNEFSKLNFGLSLGVNDAHVNYSNVAGDVSDAEIAQFNQLKPYIDGDFGIAYTDRNLYVGAAIPNLKSAFFKSSDERFDADRLLFVGIASYKIPISSEDRSFMLEPLAGFRIVKGYKDIVDIGTNFMFNNYGLYFQSIYHSSQSLGVGVGLDQRSYALSFNYNLETGPLATFTQGGFELGIKIKLFNN